jgi:hypothetical protein
MQALSRPLSLKFKNQHIWKHHSSSLACFFFLPVS